LLCVFAIQCDSGLWHSPLVSCIALELLLYVVSHRSSIFFLSLGESGSRSPKRAVVMVYELQKRYVYFNFAFFLLSVFASFYGKISPGGVRVVR
jgi:hypothetical protein